MSDNPTAGGPAAPAASEAAPAAPALAPPPASVVHEAPAAAAPAPATETPPAEAPAASPEAAPAPGAEATPAAPEAPAAPAAEAPPAEAAPTVAYTDFKLPEGFTILPEKLTEATAVLGKYGVPQEAAQELVNMHVAGLQNAIQQYTKNATDFWTKKSGDWVAEVRADPQIGGNRLETSLSIARGVWNEVLPNKADRDRLFADFNDTKMGDHPVLTRAMVEAGRRMQQVLQATGTTTWAAAMKKIREPAAPPPGTPARAPGVSGRAADRRYQNRHQGA